METQEEEAINKNKPTKGSKKLSECNLAKCRLIYFSVQPICTVTSSEQWTKSQSESAQELQHDIHCLFGLLILIRTFQVHTELPILGITKIRRRFI